MLRVYKKIFIITIVFYLICTASMSAFADNSVLTPVSTTPSFELTTASDSKYTFVYKYLKDKKLLDDVYYDINILSAYISNHTQLSVDSNTSDTDGSITISLPNQNAYLKYTYSDPEDYSVVSSQEVDNANISKKTFKNISSSRKGGAVSISSDTQSTIKSDFINNKVVDNSGGAIFNEGNSSVDGVFIENNISGDNINGGAISNSGTLSVIADFVKNSAIGSEVKGGALSNMSVLTDSIITSLNANFLGNYASASTGNAYGGAIYNYTDANNVDTIIRTLTGSFLANQSISNSSSAYGGAIYNGGLYAQISSIDADFMSNKTNAKTNSYGGAIYNNSIIETLTGDFVSNSSVSTLGIASGGAIYNKGKINALKGLFISNFATGMSAQGGAISNSGYMFLNDSSFVENKVSSNSDSSKGGAIYNNGVFSFQGQTVFSGNYAYSLNQASMGGVIYNAGTMTGTIAGEFNANFVQSISGNSYGGSIYNIGFINIMVAPFTSSLAKGISAYGGAIYSTNEIVTIKSDFDLNSSVATTVAQGGAIYSSGTVQELYSEFNQNYVDSANLAQGGAIYNLGDIYAFSLDDTTSSSFNNNYSISTSGNSEGGAIYNEGFVSTMNKVGFTGNYAKSNNSNAIGGAIYNNGIIGNIVDSRFENNYTEALKSTASGGAIYSSGSIKNLSTEFVQNYALGNSAQGGALFNSGVIVTITSTFEENGAKSTTGNAYGGAIYHSGLLTNGILNSTFANNYAVSTSGNAYGGAIYAISDLSIKADNGTTSFSGNYIQSVNGDKVYQDIYVGESSVNLALKSTNNGIIQFDGDINGVSGYRINILGDDTSSVVLNSKVYNAIVTLNDISFQFNTETFKETNSLLVTNSGTINFIDSQLKNYVISNLTSSEKALYSLDIDPLNNSADTITVEKSANGVIKIDNINYLNTLTKTTTIRILYTDSEDITLFLDNEVDDLSRTISNTIYNTDVFIQDAGASILDKHYIKLLYGEELDGLKLINEKVAGYGEERKFIFDVDSSNNYKVRDDLTSIGITSAGELSVVGVVKSTGRSLINFSGATGFNLQNQTVLNVSNTTLSNSSTVLILNNENAVANLENVMFVDNSLAIQNLLGTVNLNNSIIEQNTVGENTNRVLNSSLMVLNNSIIKTDIENTGNFNLYGDDKIYNIVNMGTVRTSNVSAFLGNFINNQKLFLTNKVSFEGVLTNNLNGVVTTSDSDDTQGIIFNRIENEGKITLGSLNDNLSGAVLNSGDIVVEGKAKLTSTISGVGTTNVKNDLTISADGVFTEEQGLKVDYFSTVTVDGGDLTINTSNLTQNYDIINGTIIGKSGVLNIKDSTISDNQISIVDNADITVNLSNTIMDFSNNSIKNVNLGKLVSDVDSTFKLDMSLENATIDTITLHSDSNAVINVVDLIGLSKDNIPMNYNVVLKVLNDDTNAVLYLDEEDGGIVQKYKSTSELSDFYNTESDTYEVTSKDFIGTMGIALDDTKKSIIVGNLTGYDLLNYMNIQQNIKRKFTVLSSGYQSSKSIGVTGAGSMEVAGEGVDKNLYIIDLGNTYSGFEVIESTNLTIRNLTIANALSSAYATGSALNVLSSNATIIVDNVLFKNNIAKLSGGAIYNEGVITELVNSSFIGNEIQSDDGSNVIHGGAIYTRTDLTIKADNGVSNFEDNYIQNSVGEKSAESIYVSNNSSTLTLESINNGQIIFNDYINGEIGYNVQIVGDESGCVLLNDKIYNANVTLNNTRLNISTDTFMNSNSSLNVQTGVLSTKDNDYTNYVIDNLTSSSDARYLIDFSLYIDSETNNLKYNTDTITVSNNSSSGTIYLSDENFDYLGLKDRTSELSQYFFNNRNSYVLIKILDTTSNVVIDMQEYIQDYSVAYYNYDVKSSDFIGIIGIRATGNDSIEAGVLSSEDSFVSTNKYVYDGTRRFTLEKDYLLNATGFETTGAGKFEVIGNDKTIDFNGKDGFKTNSTNKTELVLNNLVFTNSNSAIITTTDNRDTTVIVNDSLFKDNKVAVTNGGTLYFNNVTVNKGDSTNENVIKNDGSLYLNGENTISSNITGNGNVYMNSGMTDLSNSFVENNTFTINSGSLKFSADTFSNANLVLNDGELLIGDSNFIDYNIKQLNIGNVFNLKIDVDFNNKLFDKFVVGAGSSGTLMITEFSTFEMSEYEEYHELKILERLNPNDSIELALSDELKSKPVANYSIERYFVDGHYEANDSDYICTIMLDINDTKDSLVIKAEKIGSVLSLFNQHKYKERIFNIVSDEYVEEFNLGTTAAGKMVVNGNGHLLNMDNHSGFEILKAKTVLELNDVNVQNAKTAGNGSVINATVYKDNQVIINDSSFSNNTSDGLGGAIFTALNLSISSVNKDVVFENNLSNNLPNDIYLNNIKNTNLMLNLDANSGTKIALKGGIDFDKSGLILNINKSKLGGIVEIAGNLGTSDSKIINNFNLYGGTLSFVDDNISEIYIKNLNLYNNTVLNIDIDVRNSVSDRFIIPEKVTLPSNKLLLNIDELNMLSFFDNIEDSTAVRLINTNQLTSKYFGFTGTDNDVAKYNYSGVDYFFILATEGYLVVSRDVPDYYLHPLVCAIKNMVSNTYTMYSDNLLYNYGSLSKNPTQNRIQSNKLVIKGNNNSILAGYLSEGDAKLSGIALVGSNYYPAYKQEFYGYDVTFKGFKNALMNRGGKLVLSNVNFENNISDENGNAILNESGTVLLSGSKKLYSHLYNNSSKGNGGAIYNSGTITIQYVKFGEFNEDGTSLGNSAKQGGAIYNLGNLTVSNSEFISNSAEIEGGAINNSGNFKSTANKFTSNTSIGNGGAISTSSNFVDKLSEFTSNKAENGGAIYHYQFMNTSELSLTSTNFNGNIATNAGGAVYVDSGVATIKTSKFGLKEGNTAIDGAGIYNKGTLNSVSNVFSNNIATNGGAIYNNGKFNDTSSNISLNTADAGGGIYNEGTGIFNKTTLSSNTAINGGAIYNVGSISLTSNNFTLNTATNGGAIYNVGTATLSKVTLGNSKSKYKASNNAVSGGAIYNEGVLNSNSSNIYYNTATLFGGAIYNDIIDNNKSLTLTTTNLSYNKTTDKNGLGGAIYNNNGQVNLFGTTVNYNSSFSGGAIYNLGTLIVDTSSKTKTSFIGNTSSFGGAINNKGSLNISNATFTSNTASEAGGALILDTVSTNSNFSANITNTVFTKNSSKFGGAIFASVHSTNSVKNYLTISNSSFTSNKSTSDGGAIYADKNSYIQIIDTDFKNNISGGRGGAIFINGGAEVSIIADTKNVIFSGNKAGGVYNGIYLNSYSDKSGNFFKAILNLQTNNGKTISFNDYIAGVGTINIYGNTIFNKAVITNDSEIEVVHQNGTLTIYNENSFSGASLTLNNSSSLNISNGNVGVVSLKSLKLNDTSRVSIDASLKSGQADKIQAETVTGEGKVVASSINIISNSKTPVDINVGKDSVVSSVTTNKAESAEATYKLKSYYDENGMLRVLAYGQKAKACAVSAPVATQIGGYLAQINSYDQAFMNMDMNMLVPQSEREAVQNKNCHCEEQSNLAVKKNTITTQDRDDISYNAKGLWNRPFATFERVNLNNGPKVNNVGYGNYFGGDADMKVLKNGWRRQFSAYIGYNGSVQDYERQSIDQNGGTIGITEVWYKNRFFTGLTVNAGANVAQASTDIGRENMPMFMTGVASKTGYNFEFKNGKFIVQPSLLISYSFIHTFAHDNGRGNHVGSSPLNAIQVAPGVKFIANLKNGWQPYMAVNMRWNIIDKTHFSLQDVTIPDMSIDPYIEYGLGLQRRWGERFTGFGQAMIRNGGRNGVMLSFGFKWLIGK